MARVIDVRLNGVMRFAESATEKGWTPIAGGNETAPPATLNGAPVGIYATKGRGRGGMAKPMMYYVYFPFESEWWYITIGKTGFPPRIDLEVDKWTPR